MGNSPSAESTTTTDPSDLTTTDNHNRSHHPRLAHVNSRPLAKHRNPLARSASPTTATTTTTNGTGARRPAPTAPIDFPSTTTSARPIPLAPARMTAGASAGAGTTVPSRLARGDLVVSSSPFVGSALSYTSSSVSSTSVVSSSVTSSSHPPSTHAGSANRPDLSLLDSSLPYAGQLGSSPSPVPDMLSPPLLPLEGDASLSLTTGPAHPRLPPPAATASPTDPLAPVPTTTPTSALTAALRSAATPSLSASSSSPSPSLAAGGGTPSPSISSASPRTRAGSPTLLPPSAVVVPTTIAYQFRPSADTLGMNVAPTAVYLTGTFNAWRTKVPLRRRGSGDTTTAASVVEYAVTLALAPGVYRLKFIVDDEWRCSDAMPTAQDEDGNLVNFVEVLAPPPPPQPPLASRGESMVVARSTPPLPPLPPLMSSSPATTASPMSAPSRSATRTPLPPLLSTSPPESYSTAVPSPSDLLALAAAALPSGGAAAVAVAPPTGFSIVQGPDGRPVLEPPVLPAQLTKVVLNGRTATNSSSSSHAAAAAEMGVDETAVGVPAHVSVGHLYACSIRDGVMAVAVTSRYRKKCVTTVVYRAVDI